ncbi:MAG: hypothetical protein IJK98_08670 [Clostridia bacterium]|nr:hypothetical protein [Clostridia bacterium]
MEFHELALKRRAGIGIGNKIGGVCARPADGDVGFGVKVAASVARWRSGKSRDTEYGQRHEDAQQYAEGFANGYLFHKRISFRYTYSHYILSKKKKKKQEGVSE